MLNLKKIRFKLEHAYRRINYSHGLRKKIRKAIKTFPEIKNEKKDKTYLAEAKKFLQENFHGYSNTSWHHYYSTLNGIKDVRYIPEELFFGRIAPVLNNNEYFMPYTDKISYDLLIDKKYLPKTILRILNFRFYDAHFNYLAPDEAIELVKKQNTDLVLKPAIYTGSGTNVTISSPAEILNLIFENPKYKSGDFIVQEKIKQHSLMAAFHPESVNTCRILTANTGKQTVEISTYLRCGRNKSKIDNAQAGGVYCGVGSNGTLKDFATDKTRSHYFKHPDSGIPFAGFKIPGFDKALDFCLQYHKLMARLTFISWDIAIGENGEPVFIELNLRKQAINGHQIVNGPLFGDFTTEIIEKYNYERKKEPIYY